MLKCFKDEKFWCAVGGAAAVILGKKVVKAKKTREVAVTGLVSTEKHEGRSI